MTGRMLVVSLVTVGVVLAIAASVDFGPRSVPAPLKDAARIEYRVQIVVDSQRVKQLEADAERLQAKADDQKAMREGIQAFAERMRDRGDTLEARAVTADEWHAAHDARKQEAESLRVVVASQDSSLATKDSAAAAKDATIDIEQAGRARAETRVAELEPLAMRAGDCKIVRFINCPTRKQAFVAGVVTAAVVVPTVVVLVQRRAKRE